MSDSDELEFDEESLKEIDREEEIYYSQIQENETNTKKRKISECLDDVSVKKNKMEHKKQPAKTDWKMSRRHLILDIIENSSEPSQRLDESNGTANTNLSEAPSNFTKPSAHSRWQLTVQSIDKSTRNQSRKNLAIELMTNNHEDQTFDNSEGVGPFPLTRKQMALNVMTKSNFQSGEENVEMKKTSSKHKNSETVKPLKEITSRNVNTIDYDNKLVSNNKDSFRKKENNQSTMIATMERKFPGPAGLLPDRIEDLDNNQISKFIEDIDNFDEDSHDDSMEKYRIEFYSQDTKKMYTNGAWKRMLNDLPPNFLRGYDIATIKSSINKSGKVSFFGGFINSIDIKLENPRVVLKDISDEINGTMHEDVSKKFTLDPGQVILLRNVRAFNRVGKSKLVVNSFIVFECENILAIYSDKKIIYKHSDFYEIIAKASNNRHSKSISYPPEGIHVNKSEAVNQDDNSTSNKLDNNDDEDYFNIDEINEIEEKHLTQKNTEFTSNDDNVQSSDSMKEISNEKQLKTNKEYFNYLNFFNDSNQIDEDDEMLSQIDLDAVVKKHTVN